MTSSGKKEYTKKIIAKKIILFVVGLLLGAIVTLSIMKLFNTQSKKEKEQPVIFNEEEQEELKEKELVTEEVEENNENDIAENEVEEVPETVIPTEIEKIWGTSDSDFKVVGYYPSWSTSAKSKLRFDVSTHINYSFAIPTAEGDLMPLENGFNAKEIIKAAHEEGVKVLIAVGGWSYKDIPLESTFVSATDTPEKLKKFGDAILAMCDEYGFDGVDMDWEHPRKDQASEKQYEELMLYLADKLHSQDKLLTAAVLSGATPEGVILYDSAAHTDKVLEAVDWINIMAYDGGDGVRHSSYEFAKACGDYWKNDRNLPSNKVVLGVPFYARPSWSSYENILQNNENAGNGDIVENNGVSDYYNGKATIKQKTEFAYDNLGGIMIWELTQDTTDTNESLMTQIALTISEKMKK